MTTGDPACETARNLGTEGGSLGAPNPGATVGLDLRRASALLGAAWILTLVGATVASSSAPGSGASDAQLLTWISSHVDTAKAIGWITLLSVVVGLCFFGVLCDYLRRESAARGLAALAFGGAVVFSVGLLMELEPYYAAAERVKHLSVSTVGPVLVVVDIGQLTQDAGIVVLTLATGLAVMRTRALPVWLGWAALVVAVLSAVPLLDPLGAFVFLVWSLAASITMYVRWAASSPSGVAQPA